MSGFLLRDDQGQEYFIGGPTTIGRGGTCQIRPGDPSVSRVHATVWAERETLYVRDEQSTNGTFVGGYRIAPLTPVPLHPGEQLGLGDILFSVATVQERQRLCPHCGAAISATAKFCGTCGMTVEKAEPQVSPARRPAPTSPAPRSIACPHCGTANPPTAKSCRRCGKTLGAPRAAAPRGVRTKAPLMERLRGSRWPLLAGGLVLVLILISVPLYLLGRGGGAQSLDREKPVHLTTLTSATVRPSDQPQTVSYKDEVSVTVPGGLLESEQTLTISAVKSGIPNELPVKSQPIATYDIQLGEMHQFDEPLMIEMAIDPQESGSPLPPEAGFDVSYWDEASEAWVAMPYLIDPDRNTLLVPTKHLSRVSVTQILADGYVGNEYFTLYYDKAELDEARGFYEGKSDDNAMKLGDDVPPIVEDTWIYLETARQRYEDATGKDGKATLEALETFRSEYEDMTPSGRTIKRYAYNVYVGGTGVGGTGSPETSKLGTITIPRNPDTPARTNLKSGVAHELFHAIQTRYYGARGMTNFGVLSRRWWLDAAAEYAAKQIVWPTDDDVVMGQGDLQLYLKESLDYEEGLLDPGKHAYNTSYFIDFLVQQKGINFVDMWNWMARSGSWDMVQALDDYIALENGKPHLIDYYRDFAFYWLYDTQSPLGAGSADKGKTIPKEATEVEWLKWGPNVKSKKFSLKSSYAAALWSIEAANPQNTASRKVAVWVLTPSPASCDVNVYVSKLEGFNRVVGGSPPTQRIDCKNAPQVITWDVKGADHLHVLAVNNSRKAQEVEIRVGTVGLQGRAVEWSTLPVADAVIEFLGLADGCSRYDGKSEQAVVKTGSDGSFALPVIPVPGDTVIRVYRSDTDWWDVPVVIDWATASDSIPLGDLNRDRMTVDPQDVEAQLQGRYTVKATASGIQPRTTSIYWDWSFARHQLSCLDQDQRALVPTSKTSNVQAVETDSCSFSTGADWSSEYMTALGIKEDWSYDILTVKLWDTSCGNRLINEGKASVKVGAAEARLEAPTRSAATATPVPAPAPTEASSTGTEQCPALTATTTANGQIDPFTFSIFRTDEGYPFEPRTLFPGGIGQVHAIYDHEAVRNGTEALAMWCKDGELYFQRTWAWEWEADGFAVERVYADALPSGNFEFRLYLDGSLAQVGTFVIDPPQPGAPTIGTVQFAEGQADSNPVNLHAPGESFRYGTTEIYAFFERWYTPPGTAVKGEWYCNGALEFQQDATTSSDAIVMLNWNSHFHDDQSPLPSGDWEFRYYIDGRLVQSGTFVIEP